MDLERLKSTAVQSFNNIKDNSTAFYTLIAIGLLIVILVLVRQYKKIVAQEKAEPIFIRNIKNAYQKPVEVLGKEIYPPDNGLSFSYSTWLYINDFNKKKADLKHVFHKGDLNMNTMAPGVFISPQINSIAILFDTENRIKSTVSTTKSANMVVEDKTKDIQAIFPMDNACGCEEILKLEPTYKMASFDKDEQGNGTCYLFDKTKNTIKNDSATTWVKKQNNIHTMNPYENPFILFDDKSCVVVENVPIQRWFNIVIVANTSSVEVYIDGKLYKTLVLQSPVKMNSQSLFSGLNDGFDGMINELRYFPYPLKYMDVYNLYNRGPTPFYFMYMFSGKTELYQKFLTSVGDVFEDSANILTNLSEDIYGRAD